MFAFIATCCLHPELPAHLPAKVHWMWATLVDFLWCREHETCSFAFKIGKVSLDIYIYIYIYLYESHWSLTVNPTSSLNTKELMSSYQKLLALLSVVLNWFSIFFHKQCLKLNES